MSYIVHKAVEVDALSAKAKAALEAPQTWVVSPKYDGCHAVFLFENGKHLHTYSRSGEFVYSMQHIADSLLRHYGYLLADGKWAITGEAWSGDKEFNVISGLFRKHSAATDLGFVPFDFVEWQYNDESTSGPIVDLYSEHEYIDRLDQLVDQYSPISGSQVRRPVYFGYSGSLASVVELAASSARHYKEQGVYDGVIVARANGKYIAGSGKGGEFIKIKPLISHTVTVTGAALDFGTKTGKNTAALKFVLDGMEQKVSTGLSQEQVDEITAVGWDGFRIEVEAMGKTINGYLREPRFKGVRYDA